MFRSATVVGIAAFPVEVEIDLQEGLPSFSTVGLPDAAIRESRDRVRSALANSGCEFPTGRVTVNLAPADLRKEGSGFDLAIAMGLLAVQGLLPAAGGGGSVLVGELSLDGALKGVRGVLPMAMQAREDGCRELIVPACNAREAALVEGLSVRSAPSLGAVVRHMAGEEELPLADYDDKRCVSAGEGEDLADVRGQEAARRALEVAAAGGHNILLFGPPGTGKTLLARCLPSILPPLGRAESLETTRVYSVAGLVAAHSPLVVRRPFRSPHHTVSYAGMAGGGAYPRPGEISLAHNGVLFLDEMPEFSPRVLQVLRQPMEEGSVTVARAAQTLTYPARFSLAAAMNPCPCGYYGDGGRACRCAPGEIHRYRGRISGPLLDRFDIQVEVPSVPFEKLRSGTKAEPSSSVAARVREARLRQYTRFGRSAVNAAMTARAVRRHCPLDREGEEILRAAFSRFALSARAVTRVLKVARTVADLGGRRKVAAADVAEAIQYRGCC
jgi:magnesium chelatase family protein